MPRNTVTGYDLGHAVIGEGWPQVGEIDNAEQTEVLCAGQEATARTGHGTTDWFQIGKGIRQACIYCHSAYLTYIQSTS